MKWFFTLNDFSKEWLSKSIDVMLATRPKWFEPICLADCSTLPCYPGVEVIPWQVTFANSLRSLWERTALTIMPNTNGQLHTAPFIPLDIPYICDKIGVKDECVLTTHIDIMFMGECEGLKKIRPELAAAMRDVIGPNPQHIGDSVLLLNPAAMLTRRERMLEHIAQLTTPTDSEMVFNAIYPDASELPADYHWPQYWGPRATAEIIHFCGPKPLAIRPPQYPRTHWEDLQRGSGWTYYEKRFVRTWARVNGVVKRSSSCSQ